MVATRSTSRSLTPGLDMDAPDQRISPRKQRAPASAPAPAPAPAPPAGWSHAPTTTTLIWLFISLPLVTWDTGYVLGRPATMPGGWAHSPFYKPYALYGQVDQMYGFKQYNLGNGFTSAQGALNVIETIMYIAYFVIWYRAAGSLGLKDAKERRRIAGSQAGLAVLLGFSASVMTVSKTLLYFLNEYFSSFDNVRQNTPWDLLFLWIIPNGAWILVPSHMIYQLGYELLDAVKIASRATGSVKND